MIIRATKLMRGGGLIQITIGVILLIASPIGATDTRVETLGASALFLEDEYNIWHYPAALLRYPDLLVFSFGGRTNALTPPSELYTVGTFALPRSMALGIAFGSGQNAVTYAPLVAQERLHLFWGVPVGSRKLGVRFSRFSAVRNAVPSYERSVSTTHLGTGLESQLGANMLLETALSLNITNFKDIVNGEKNSEPMDYWGLELRMRGIANLGNNTRIIPLFEFSWNARGVRFFSAGQETGTEEEDHLTARIGAAFEINPREDLLVIFHTSALYDHTVSKSSASSNGPKATIWDLPLAGLGLEKWIRPWLAFRVGAMLRLWLDDSESAGGASSQWQTHTSTAQTVGLALHLGSFQADFAVAPAMLKEGPYIMSGMKAPLFTKVTLRYHF